MSEKELKERAWALYTEGFPTGKIAEILHVAEYKIVRWLNLG